MFKSSQTELGRSVTDSSPPTWQDLPGSQCIAQWAEEIRNTLATDGDAHAWRLVGTGAVIENSDLDICESIFRRAAKHAGLQFLVIPQDKVADIFLDDAPSFFTMKPAMIYLEPGDWMSETSEGTEKSPKAFRKSLSSAMKGFNPREPVIFVTAAYRLTDMADMLRASGLFDRRFALRPQTPLELGRKFLDRLGLDICAPSLANYSHKLGIIAGEYPNARIRDLHVLHLQRIAAREKRQLELIDVIAVGFEGSVETDTRPAENQTLQRSFAVHEAGHAVIAIVDSSGRNTPDFLSIRETSDFNGLAVDAYLYSHSTRHSMTYLDFRHQIRSYLAGRAAEEVVFGAKNVTGSCCTDLASANILATKAFCRLGFAPHMDSEDVSGANLAVAPDAEPGQDHEAYVRPMIREFLAGQYQEVISMLVQNRNFLDEVTDTLLKCQVMDQGALLQLGSKYLQHAIESGSPISKKTPS